MKCALLFLRASSILLQYKMAARSIVLHNAYSDLIVAQYKMADIRGHIEVITAGLRPPDTASTMQAPAGIYG